MAETENRMTPSAELAGGKDYEDGLQATMRTLYMILMMQLLGYLAKARGLLGDHAQAGLAGYVYNVGLPAVLFNSVAVLDMDEMAIQIVAGVMLAKLVLVVLARSFAHLITRRDDDTGAADTLGGLVVLLCTMSDDLGVGVPLFAAFFPKNLHAVGHLFILSALQSIFISPIAFVFLGVGVASSQAHLANDAASLAADKGGQRVGRAPTRLEIFQTVVLDLRKNPLVIAALAGNTAHSRLKPSGSAQP